MNNYLLIPFLPLAAFIVKHCLWRKFIKDRAHWVSTVAVVLSWLISL